MQKQPKSILSVSDRDSEIIKIESQITESKPAHEIEIHQIARRLVLKIPTND